MIIGIDIRNIGKNRTGDEVVFFNLARELARLDQKNEYRLFTDITEESILEKIKNDLGVASKNNFQIISLPTSSKFIWNLWTLPKYLRKYPVNVYLTQYITPLFVSKKIKIVTIIHDISFNFYPQFIKFSDRLFLKILIPLSLHRADKIIAVSRFTAQEIERYYKIDREKISWVHNAVGEKFIKKILAMTPEEMTQVKKKYNLPEKYILYLGTFQPRKNILALIEAYALVKEDIEPVKLVLAGGKSHNFDQKIDEIVKKNQLNENVIFPGYIQEEDKPALYSGALVFCFPSFYEGFGIPILEAMKSGIPTVVSDIPPHREIAEAASEFFNPEVAGELSLKFREMANNEVARNNLAMAGKIQVQKFSWIVSASKMLNIFESFNKH